MKAQNGKCEGRGEEGEGKEKKGKGMEGRGRRKQERSQGLKKAYCEPHCDSQSSR